MLKLLILNDSTQLSLWIYLETESNVLCGMRAPLPQLVIRQKRVTLNHLFLTKKTILTSVNSPMVYNIFKAFFIAPQF